MTCCKPQKERFVPYFPGWNAFTPVIPQAYWNVYSAEERTLRICKLIDKIACYCDLLGDKISINRADIDALMAEFEEFKESGFDDYYAEQIIKWIDEHMEFIFTNAILGIYFGLTEDGYFCAYIPDSWDDITFDTGATYGTPEYGRLILIY